ncbi:hypothetical protein V8F33_009445 [Rhypophila sp. PSN 637]
MEADPHGGVGCLFLAGIIILSWKNSASVWRSLLVVLQLAWVRFLLLLMSSSFIAVSGWTRDGMLSTVLACVPSDLDDQGGFLISSTGFMMVVVVVDWMGVAIIDCHWQQTLQENWEDLPEDVK